MPRSPRILGDDLCYHVILRCNNREKLLYGDEFQNFLQLLSIYKSQFSFVLYDYVLMQSHVHLLLSTHQGNTLDIAMRDFCSVFSKQYNTRNQRAGHLWRDRYWCRVVDDDRYALACMRYFAWNPVKAGLVAAPSDWPWGGCRHYMGIDENRLLHAPPTYLGLGETVYHRQCSYTRLIRSPFCEDEEKLFNLRTRPQSKLFPKLLDRYSGYL